MVFQKGHKFSQKKQEQPVIIEPNTSAVNELITAAVVEPAIVQPTTTEKPATVAKYAEKPVRVPVGLRNPMAVKDDLDPNFKYRNVRASRGRIEKFLAGGYELVQGDVKIGDPNIAKASGMGSCVSIPSGDNEERVYLMRIPKEFYNEDQAAKAGKLDETEKQLKQRPKDQGLAGDVKIT